MIHKRLLYDFRLKLLYIRILLGLEGVKINVRIIE